MRFISSSRITFALLFSPLNLCTYLLQRAQDPAISGCNLIALDIGQWSQGEATSMYILKVQALGKKVAYFTVALTPKNANT